MPFPQLDQFSYHHRLQSTQGIALVYFVKDGCSSCKAWTQLLQRYQALHPAIQVFFVDVVQDPALANELSLFHLPAIFIYVNGNFHTELQSEAKLSSFEAAIQRALQSPPSEAP